MRIIDQRYLDSDNRYSTQPCLLSILELDDTSATPDALAAFDQRLQAVLPEVHRQRGLVGMRCADVPQLVQVVQQVALELRRLAFNEVTLGFVGSVPRMQGRYRLVLPYAARNSAAPALAMATQLVAALMDGRSFNLKAGVTRLRALAERRAAPRGSLIESARSLLRAVIPGVAPQPAA